jgi:hypothetical protein
MDTDIEATIRTEIERRAAEVRRRADIIFTERLRACFRSREWSTEDIPTAKCIEVAESVALDYVEREMPPGAPIA